MSLSELIRVVVVAAAAAFVVIAVLVVVVVGAGDLGSSCYLSCTCDDGRPSFCAATSVRPHPSFV